MVWTQCLLLSSSLLMLQRGTVLESFLGSRERQEVCPFVARCRAQMIDQMVKDISVSRLLTPYVSGFASSVSDQLSFRGAHHRLQLLEMAASQADVEIHLEALEAVDGSISFRS